MPTATEFREWPKQRAGNCQDWLARIHVGAMMDVPLMAPHPKEGTRCEEAIRCFHADDWLRTASGRLRVRRQYNQRDHELDCNNQSSDYQ